MGTYTFEELAPEQKEQEEKERLEREQERDFTPIPEGYYGAVVKDISEKKLPFPGDDGEDIWNMEFKFQITDDGEFHNRWISGEVPLVFSMSQNNRLFRWVEALFGQELTDSFKLDTDMLIGKPCRIRTYVKKYGEKKEKEITLVGSVYSPDSGPTSSASQEPKTLAFDAVDEPF